MFSILKQVSSLNWNTRNNGGVRFLNAIHKKSNSEELDFFILPQGTTSFAWHTQHHFERSENIIAAPCGTNERCYGVAVNEVALRANDVGLRPMKLRFAQTDTPTA